MIAQESFRHGMQVLGADGGMIGSVDRVEADHLKLQRDAGGTHHLIPLEWVSRVDDHVHLTLDAVTARSRWLHGEAGAASPYADPVPQTGRGWLPWLLGAIVLAAVLFFLMRGCDTTPPTDPVGPVDEPTVVDGAVPSASGTDATLVTDADGAIFNRDVETFLGSSEALPRSFTFNGVQFDTGSAAIRAEDQAELNALARILAARSTARAEVVGYTDSTGDAVANQRLAAERAAAVAAALVSGGVARDAITSRGGGEQATDGASQSARRTDLIITAR